MDIRFIIPVSYTHLKKFDEYQKLIEENAGQFSDNFSPSKPFPPALPPPVSYTHLDVYKRQHE